ncbi:MAG: metallophosphoesterase family protein [Proteobacteria bacterium]|nr:metallophosphoesterase family protein [Pseudomonadota bacterium]
MKLAVISDIHGNLEALQAVLAFLNGEGIKEIICLGDIVGYGADPNECIDLIRETTDQIIAGNHDWGTIGLTDTSFFNPVAKAAIEWTADTVTEDSKKFLVRLPLTITRDDFLFVHGTPSSPEDWDYLFRAADALQEFKSFPQKACFIGHSHTPLMFARDQKGMVFQVNYTEQRLEDDRRYIINVGSVGQPRDMDPDAAVGIYDRERKYFILERIPYNIKTAQEKIIKAGLPAMLAERLGIGW